VAGLAAAVTGLGIVPQQASAVTATTLYVNNMSGTCSDSGSGTQATPYCTIQAAANAATAGDTVLIAGSDYSSYASNLVISSSGTAADPITFEPSGAPFYSVANIKITGGYVVVSGANTRDSQVASLVVTGSHVTLDGDRFNGGGTVPAVQVGADVNGLTVEHSMLESFGNAMLLQLGTGDTNTVLTTNVLDLGWDDLVQVAAVRTSGVTSSSSTTDYPAITVSADSNTDITSNTIIAQCFTGVTVNKSTGTSIENNIISDDSCQTSGRADVAVDAASAGSTTEAYNLLSQDGGGVKPYSWAGTTYTTQSAFAAATGQGSADTVQGSVSVSTSAFEEAAIGTANPNAPGESAVDLYGNAWPQTSPDRGAIAQQEFSSADASLVAVGYTPQQVAISLDLHGVAWGSPTMTVDWGDGSAAVDDPIVPNQRWDFSDNVDYHIYAQRGTYTITVTLNDPTQTITKTATVSTNGSTYIPVTPTRVLDTRKGIGAAQAKVGPNSTLPVNVTLGVTLPSDIGTITAVVMNVTVTNPTSNGNIAAYPAGSAVPTTSNVNFAAKETVPNLVTVQVGAGDVVDLRNNSSGSSDLVADVQGYYVASDSGSYYLPNNPSRVLDTRKGTGATGPVTANGTVTLSIPQCVSGSGSSKVTATATAVALNVTVTSPATDGHITAYPDQSAVPGSSNLNFIAGETVPNLVVVEVGSDGKVDLRNISVGTVQLVADLEGCYSATLGDAFVPITPYRALDTRTGIGQFGEAEAVAPDLNAAWDSGADPTNGGSEGARAVVMNVTVTQPKAAGYITAYPSTASMPNASNLNFTVGETVPNLVMVPSLSGVSLRNNSNGTTQLIADFYGYFS